MMSKIVLVLLPILSNLMIQSISGLKSPELNSYYGLPLLYPYGNCSEEIDTQTIHFYLTHTLPDPYKTYANVWQMKTNYIAAPQPTTRKLVEDGAVIPILQTDTDATEYNQCMSYYCDETTNSSQNVCHNTHQVTGVFTYTWPYDPSVFLFAVYKETHSVQVLPLIPLPAPVNKTESYIYYMLYGNSYNKPDFIVDTIAIMPLLDNNPTQITTALTANVHIYKNVEILSPGISNQLSLQQWDVLWLENTREVKGQSLSLTKITSTGPLAVHTAYAKVNQSSNTSFSYISTFSHQMPDTKRWGKKFVVDLTHIEMLPEKRYVIASFSVLAVNETDVTVKMYRDQEQTSYRRFRLGVECLDVTTITYYDNDTFPTHLVIQGSQGLLILYEAYTSRYGNNRTHFSMVLQPVDWFTFKQSAILTAPLKPHIQTYNIALVSLKQHLVKVHTRQATPTNIRQYGDFEQVESIDISSYTIYRISVKTNKLLDKNNMLVFTAEDSNGCQSKLGASLFSCSNSSSYAHNNPYVLEDTITEENSTLCRRKFTTTYVIASAVTVTVLLVVIFITITVVVIILMKPRILFQKPDPPANDFEYDIFLSFADQDKDLITELLYSPLKQRGYKVFWHLSDFIAGLTIAENMLKAIQTSRWVVFICSKHFEESEFCQQELKFGLNSHYNTYKGKYRRVIPIVVQQETCPQKLKQLRPIKCSLRESDCPNNKDIKDIIKRLNFGKPLKVLKEKSKAQGRRHSRPKETETDEDMVTLLSTSVV